MCLCAALRRAARIVTRKYDFHLAKADLRITQYSMLANIIRNPDISVSNLSKTLAMDQTTATRNLQVLNKAGLIHFNAETTDQRIKKISISSLGLNKFKHAKPMWLEAQKEIEQVLSGSEFKRLKQSLQALEE